MHFVKGYWMSSSNFKDRLTNAHTLDENIKLNGGFTLWTVEGPYRIFLGVNRPYLDFKKTQRQLYTLILMLLASVWGNVCLASGSSLVILDKQSDYYQPLTRHIEYLIDETRELTIEDVVEQQDFLSVTTEYAGFGLTEGRVWMKATLRNPFHEAGVWRLDLRRQYIQEVGVYVVRGEKKPELVMYDTDETTFNERQLKTILLGTDIHVPALELIDVYVGYRSVSTTYLPIAIGSPEATVSIHAQEHNVNWLMNGALIAMTAFALLMTPIIRMNLSFGFTLYILAGMGYVLNADGYTFQYLWPQNPELNDPMNLALMLLMPIFGLNFSRTLFKFKKYTPTFDHALILFITIALVFSVSALMFIEVNWVKVVGYSLVPIGSALQVVSGVVALKRNLLGATPYLIGSLIVLSSMIYALIAHLMPGHFDLDMTLDYGHLALLCECFAFAAAMTIRLVGLRDERDRALNAELAAVKDKLKLSAELQTSQDNYIHARKVSDLRRAKLTSVSHDLQQPLSSLRMALSNLNDVDNETNKQMSNAFDYLESLARDQLSKLDSAANGTPSGYEIFPIRVVLDNVIEMFADEAKSKGIQLRYRPSEVLVCCDPITVMRVISNLVANAVKHTDSGSVLLASRVRDNRLSVEVWDTGLGLSERQIEHLIKPREKGEDSTGYGLGLSIVKELSEQFDLKFLFESKIGIGSKASIKIARAE